MKIGIKKTVDVDVKVVRLQAKIDDRGTYTFYDQDSEVIKELEDCYVLPFIPGRYGDYIDLKIDLETGQILNWNKADVIMSVPEILSDDED